MTPTEIRNELIDIAGRTHDKALDERVRRLADKVCPPEKMTAEIAIDRLKQGCDGKHSCFVAGKCLKESPPVNEWCRYCCGEFLCAALARPTLTRKQVEDAINNVSIGEPSRKFVDELANALVGTPLPERKEVTYEKIEDAVKLWDNRADEITQAMMTEHFANVILYGLKDPKYEASKSSQANTPSRWLKPKEVSEEQIQKLVETWYLASNSFWTRQRIEKLIREALSLQGTKVAERIATT